jgi:hypothetical protein
MIKVIGHTAVSDTGFTLKVVEPNPYDPQDDPRIEYREGDRVLKGRLESHWSLKVHLSSLAWEPPYEKELITAEKGKQIEANVIEALESMGHFYFSF